MRRTAALLAVAVAASALAPGAGRAAKRHRGSGRSSMRVSRVVGAAAGRPGWGWPGGSPGSFAGPASITVPVGVGSAPTTPPPAPPLPDPPPTRNAIGVQQIEKPKFTTTLSRASVAAGDVTVQLQNTGEDPHNLEIERTDGVFTPVTFDAAEPFGGTVTQTVRLVPGTYRLFCALPGHAAAGMHATLTVTPG